MQERLDVRMVREGYAASREKAKQLILENRVTVGDRPALKAGQMVTEDEVICVAGATEEFVGRGGYKLEKVITECRLTLDGFTCMDVGASTGGFTDCMLRHGAGRVYAVDVGCNQLAEKLRKDSRVVSAEKTNARHLGEQHFGERMDFVAMDVSFISLSHMFAPVSGQMKKGAKLVCLIKPQFEAGRENLNKHGIVKRDKKLHNHVVTQVLCQAVMNGFTPIYLTDSPITGGDGNIEYLLCAVWEGKDAEGNPGMGTGFPADRIEDVVNEAFLHHCQSGKGRK